MAAICYLRAIPLPRVEGRIDHLAYDPDGQRLFVAALGNDTVEVIDVAAGTHLKTIPGFREPQGIAVATDAKVVAVANGRGEGLQFIGASDHRPGAAVMLGDDADNVRYDRDARTLYVGYGPARSPPLRRPTGESSAAWLAGHPESFQLESPARACSSMSRRRDRSRSSIARR